MFPTVELTVEFWMKHTITDSNFRALISYAAGSSFNEFSIMRPNSFIIQVGEYGTWETQYSNKIDGPLNDGNWHHVAVTWKSETGEAILYVDGVPVKTTNSLNVDHSIATGGAVAIAQDQDAVGGGFQASDAFVGSMDEVSKPFQI